jgi:hypothetical protein
VSFIDFNQDRIGLNEFVAADQVRVQRATGEFVVLDVVPFVNGIPIIMVECKSPDTYDAVNTAVRDLRAYASVPLPLPPPEGIAADTKDRLVGVGRFFHISFGPCDPTLSCADSRSSSSLIEPSWKASCPEI